MAEAPTYSGNVGATAAVWRVLNVSVSIPSIAANSESTVSAAMPSMLPGDNAVITLAPGSATPPANVSPTVIFCTTAGTAQIKYVNNSGGLTTASTATTITANFTLIR